MIGLFLTLALLVTMGAAGSRVLKRYRLRKLVESSPAGSVATAVGVDDFDGIEAALAELTCPCGGRFRSGGERSERDGERVLRVLLVECLRCEERGRRYFDVSRAYH